MRLTAKTYTDAGLLPIADAVLNLPSMVMPITGTQIGTQNLFRAGHDLSQQDTQLSKIDSPQAPNNQELVRALPSPDQTSPEKKKNGQDRIRTCEGNASRFTVYPVWPLRYLPGKRRCTSHRELASICESARDENAFLKKVLRTGVIDRRKRSRLA